MALLKALWAALVAFFKTPPLPPLEEPAPKYLWDTIANIKHSVRVLCDEAGLTLEQKNTLFTTVWAESGFKLDAKRENIFDGKVWSTDWGLCQINTHFWIGAGKQFPSPEYVIANPEACVRWMCRQWKLGHRDWWTAYKNGSYKKYL